MIRRPTQLPRAYPTNYRSSAASMPYQTRVYGVIQSGGTPLSGASIAVGSKTAVSAADGTWSIEGLKPGTYAGTVTKTGYTTVNLSSIVVYEGEATNVGTASMTAAGAVVSGSIDCVGAAPGETITYTINLSSTPGAVVQATANSSGHAPTTYSISGVSVGLHRCSASAVGSYSGPAVVNHAEHDLTVSAPTTTHNIPALDIQFTAP